MIIVHSDRKGVTNFEQCKQVTLDDRFIHAVYVDGTNKIIGVYDDSESAREVFCDMLNKLFPKGIYTTAANVYYMPFKETS